MQLESNFREGRAEVAKRLKVKKKSSSDFLILRLLKLSQFVNLRVDFLIYIGIFRSQVTSRNTQYAQLAPLSSEHLPSIEHTFLHQEEDPNISRVIYTNGKFGGCRGMKGILPTAIRLGMTGILPAVVRLGM